MAKKEAYSDFVACYFHSSYYITLHIFETFYIKIPCFLHFRDAPTHILTITKELYQTMIAKEVRLAPLLIKFTLPFYLLPNNSFLAIKNFFIK